MPRRLRCMLLCEDLNQERFFLPILERALKGSVHVEPRLPNGGIGFVLAQLSRCGKILKRHPAESRGLVVVVDGDDAGLTGRLKQIDEVLERVGLPPRSAEQRMAVCVPSRTIETWLLWFLATDDVDETSDYKRAFERTWGNDPRAVRRASDAWFEPPAVEVEAQRLRALTHARGELQRLKAFEGR